MKRVLTIFLLIAALWPGLQAQVKAGEKTFGITGGYATRNHSATAGLQLTYAFSRHFVLAPSVDYVFRNDDSDGILVNLDYHGPWQLDKEGRWDVYHILGINYASWTTHSKDADNKDVSERRGRAGFDFGLGFAYNVTPTLRLHVQGKFNWLAHRNTGLFNAGISYVF